MLQSTMRALWSPLVSLHIDSHSNSLQVEESKPIPVSDPSVHNPFRIRYTTSFQITSEEVGLVLDFTTNRTFKIINENAINPITGTPVGFKLSPFYSQMLLSHPDSYHAPKSEFGSHAALVTRYSDDELFKAGQRTMQSTRGDGIASAIEARRNERSGNSKTIICNEDSVIHLALLTTPGLRTGRSRPLRS